MPLRERYILKPEVITNGQTLTYSSTTDTFEPATGGTGTPGADGDSAYQVAVNNGFVGTEAQWLASLVGATGADSTVPGPAGADSTVPGPQGPPGADGVGVPAGGIILILSGTCPVGYIEEVSLNGRFVLGTLNANLDIGTTGGQDTVTQVLNHTHAVNVSDSGHVHGELAPTSASGGALRFAVDTNANGSVAAGLNTASATTGISATTDNPAGGVASIDNRPSFIRVIFCRKT